MNFDAYRRYKFLGIHVLSAIVVGGYIFWLDTSRREDEARREKELSVSELPSEISESWINYAIESTKRAVSRNGDAIVIEGGDHVMQDMSVLVIDAKRGYKTVCDFSMSIGVSFGDENIYIVDMMGRSRGGVETTRT